MNTISVADLQRYFELEQRFNTHIDLNKLACGSYASYHTQIAFQHYQKGFTLCNNIYRGDNK